MKFAFSHELWTLFQDFNTLTGGANISIFETPVFFSQNNNSGNYGNCIAYPQVEMGNIFCKMIRRSSNVDKRCLLCDAYYTDICKESRKPVVYRCHLGLLETQIPVCITGDSAAILFFGQICDCPPEETSTQFAQIWKSLHTIDPIHFPDQDEDPAPYAFYLSYYHALQHMTIAQFGAWSRFMYTISADWHERGFVGILDETPLDAVCAYIMEHIGEQIRAEDVCGALHFSRATLYRVIKNETGLGFNSYVNLLKLERSRHLLEKNHKIGEVAAALGYENVSYYSRIFHVRYGMSPSAYLQDIADYALLSQDSCIQNY